MTIIASATSGVHGEAHRSGRAAQLFPVLPSLHVQGYPRHALGALASYVPLASLLTSPFTTDACFAAYSVPTIRRRLTREAVEEVDVPMGLFVGDVDDEYAHRRDVESDPRWFDRERRKVRALLGAHPGAFVYRTRRGWRLIYRLPTTFFIRDDRDAVTWKVFYLECVDYLRTNFDIEADRQCASWAQLFRVPHGTREGQPRPEDREIIGDSERVGTWGRMPKAGGAAGHRVPSSVATVRSPDRYVTGALRAAVALVAHAQTGERNPVLNSQAYGLARFVVTGELDEESFVTELTSAARYAGLGESEITSTIASALAAQKRRS